MIFLIRKGRKILSFLIFNFRLPLFAGPPGLSLFSPFELWYDEKGKINKRQEGKYEDFSFV